MARLIGLGVLAIFLATCASTGPSPMEIATTPPQPSDISTETSSVGVEVETPQSSPLGPMPPVAVGSNWMTPVWDPDTLSFGWINLESWGRRLGTDGNFWTESRDLWKAIRSSGGASSESLFTLTQMFRTTANDAERFWAAYAVYRLYRDAGLEREAGVWRGRALGLRRVALLTLDQVWDLAFLSKDLVKARSEWATLGDPSGFEPQDGSRYRLVRQRLFSGELSLVSLGIDPYVSTMALDRDDLWVGTWNGALARVSLVSGDWTVLEKPAVKISPIRLVRINRFFVYVFREQGFSRYSKVTGGWREFSYPSGWSGLRVQDVVLTGDEGFWLAHLGQGLWSWRAGEWQSHLSGSPSTFVNSVSPGPQGSLLVGTQDKGLWRWWNETWDRVTPTMGQGPENISALVRAPRESDLRWAVGTYGQGLWMTDGKSLAPLSTQGEYVTAVDWSGDEPWWSILDQGLWHGDKGPWEVLGLRDGLADPSATALVTHGGRLFWGTTGRSVQFWSEHDDPLVYR